MNWLCKLFNKLEPVADNLPKRDIYRVVKISTGQYKVEYQFWHGDNEKGCRGDSWYSCDPLFDTLDEAKNRINERIKKYYDEHATDDMILSEQDIGIEDEKAQ